MLNNKTIGLLVRGGRIIDPGQSLDATGNILIRNGKIAWLDRDDELPESSGYDVLAADGLVICPGFIDLHCHLREPGFEQKETIATGTMAAARGGFTTVCCMPNTNPPLDNVDTIEWVNNKARREGVVRVVPVACVTRNRAGRRLVEMDRLAGLGIAGFSDDGDPVKDSKILQSALENTKRLGMPVIDHCEEFIGGPPESEIKIVARDLELAEKTGGWIHITHVSTAGAVKLIRKAKENRIRVTADVTPHHLALTRDAVEKQGSMAKVNPPLRTEEDNAALIKGLCRGIIDCIATDHAPHAAADKQKEYALAAAGISGFETAFGLLMGLVHRGELALPELLSTLTQVPARILGGRFGSIGGLKKGYLADIAIIDPDREWTVAPRLFASRGKNTPLGGLVLKGKVMATISNGRIVYKDAYLTPRTNER